MRICFGLLIAIRCVPDDKFRPINHIVVQTWNFILKIPFAMATQNVKKSFFPRKLDIFSLHNLNLNSIWFIASLLVRICTKYTNNIDENKFSCPTWNLFQNLFIFAWQLILTNSGIWFFENGFNLVNEYPERN